MLDVIGQTKSPGSFATGKPHPSLTHMVSRKCPPIVTRYIAPDYGGAGDWEAKIREGSVEISGYGDTEKDAIADAEQGWSEHIQAENTPHHGR